MLASGPCLMCEGYTLHAAGDQVKLKTVCPLTKGGFHGFGGIGHSQVRGIGTVCV